MSTYTCLHPELGGIGDDLRDPFADGLGSGKSAMGSKASKEHRDEIDHDDSWKCEDKNKARRERAEKERGCRSMKVFRAPGLEKVVIRWTTGETGTRCRDFILPEEQRCDACHVSSARIPSEWLKTVPESRGICAARIGIGNTDNSSTIHGDAYQK